MDMHYFLSWVEQHSGLVFLASLIIAILSALFSPPVWRRVLASVFIGSIGVLFLPYDGAHVAMWMAKSFVVAVVFAFAFWWVVERLHNWRAKQKPVPLQPSGTLEATAETVSRIIVGDSGHSKLRVRLSTNAGTFTITKHPEKEDQSK